MKWKTKFIETMKRYKHAWVFLYALIYMPWFWFLEKHVTMNYHVVQTALDEEIPFIEYFIVPYLLWFVWIAGTFVYFYIKSREDFYHAFLAGIFAGAGYPVESNKEHGEGRSDVIVYNPREAKVAVFEAKYAKKLCDMDKACDMALLQINERMYAEEFADDYDEILCYGISFFRKRCRVRKR